MSRAVVYVTHGGPELLEVRQVTELHVGPRRCLGPGAGGGLECDGRRMA